MNQPKPSQAESRIRSYYYPLVISLFLLLYILPLGQRALVVPDETRYAQVPREMISSGDWIVPRLNGLLYFEKPVMGYWLNGLSEMVFGLNRFAVRLPSALAVGLTALLLFLMARFERLKPETVFLVVVSYLSALQVYGSGTFAVLDSMFSAAVSSSLSCFYVAYRSQAMKRFLFLILFGIALGVAFLIKGALALALPGVAIVAFLTWEKQFKLMFTLPWVPLFLAILTVLPWGLAIHWQQSDFWNYFFWEEHVKRFASQNAQHAKPFWFFVPVLLVGMLPWSLYTPWLLKKPKTASASPSFQRFVICWFLFPFLLLSIAKGKLQTYVLPCIPAISLIICLNFEALLDTAPSVWMRRSLKIFGYLLVIVSGFGFFLSLGLIPKWKIYQPDETLQGCLLAGGILIWGILSLRAAQQKSTWSLFQYTALCPLVFFLNVHFVLPRTLKAAPVPGELLQALSPAPDSETLLFSDDKLMSAVCWYYGRTDVALVDTEGESDYGLKHEPTRLYSIEKFRQLINDPRRKQRVVLLAYRKRYENYRQGLTVTPQELSQGQLVLVSFPGNE